MLVDSNPIPQGILVALCPIQCTATRSQTPINLQTLDWKFRFCIRTYMPKVMGNSRYQDGWSSNFQAFSFTNFSRSKRYFPIFPSRRLWAKYVKRGVREKTLTFLVFLGDISSFVVEPPNAFIASKTVNVSDRMDSSTSEAGVSTEKLKQFPGKRRTEVNDPPFVPS